MNGVSCQRRIYEDRMNTHTHAYAQLILPMHGRLHIETNRKKLTLEDEYLFFLPPDCEHSFGANKSNEFLVLDIPNTMVKNNDMEKLVGGKEILLDEQWKSIRKNSSFTRVFKRFEQMTPAQFRKKHKIS